MRICFLFNIMSKLNQYYLVSWRSVSLKNLFFIELPCSKMSTSDNASRKMMAKLERAKKVEQRACERMAREFFHKEAHRRKQEQRAQREALNSAVTDATC